MIKQCVVCGVDITKSWSNSSSRRAIRSDRKYCSKRCWGIDYRTTKEGWAKSLVARAKTRAKQKKIDFNITKEFVLFLLDEQDNKCAITNLPITFSDSYEGKIDQYRGSLDRIDSNLGYTKDNVQVVCAQVNIMKHQATTKDLIFWATKIVEGLT